MSENFTLEGLIRGFVLLRDIFGYILPGFVYLLSVGLRTTINQYPEGVAVEGAQRDESLNQCIEVDSLPRLGEKNSITR